MHTSILEEFVNSLSPQPFDLADFLIYASRVPQFSEAPVRSVDCYRVGVHDYLILSCEVTMPSTDQACIVWFRLERNPSRKTIGMFSGKQSPAADTVQAHRDLRLLNPANESRGHIVYHAVDNPRNVLRLRHIFDMYKYLAQRSSNYAMYKTNCRWLCFGLFECLRDCQPCYGGHCMGSKRTSWNDDQSAVEAKNVYLKEMHSTCCFSAHRPVSILQALVAESSGVAIAGAMAHAAAQAHTLPNATDPAVIYSTTGPPTQVPPPVPQPTQPPVNSSSFPFSSPPNPQPRPTQHHTSQPSMDRFSMSQGAGGYYPPYPSNQPGTRPHPQSRPTHAPSSYGQRPVSSHVPSSSYSGSCAHGRPISQVSMDAHSEYYQHPGGKGLNNAGPCPRSPSMRAGTMSSCSCGGHDAYGARPPPPSNPAPPPPPPQSYHACGPQCHHQQVHPQQHPPHEPQCRPQPQPRPQPRLDTFSYPPPPPQARTSIYSSPPESSCGPAQCNNPSHRPSMHIPPGDQSHFAAQNNWGQSQCGCAQAPAPSPPRQETCSCANHSAAPPPAHAPVSQAAHFGYGFHNQTYAHGQAPGGDFMGAGAPEHNHHNPPYRAPQSQQTQPARSWTEQVWNPETTGLPLRTESPSQMEMPMDGAVPNGMPAFDAGMRMPDAQDYLHQTSGAYMY